MEENSMTEVNQSPAPTPAPVTVQTNTMGNCERCGDPVKTPTHPHNARHRRFCTPHCRSLFHYENNKTEYKAARKERDRASKLKKAATAATAVVVMTNEIENPRVSPA